MYPRYAYPALMFLALSLGMAFAETVPPPTLQDVTYGPEERQQLDLWLPEGSGPRPAVIYIHGGGFAAGSKANCHGRSDVKRFLNAGCAYASINYRFLYTAPIQDILHDTARSVQFLRYKADEWKLDKTRVACYGTSAGAGSSLWIAFHDDLADPDNADPVLRESSRVIAAGAIAGQYTYDLLQWEKDLGASPYDYFGPIAGLFYHRLDRRKNPARDFAAIRAEVDMRGLITPDDPPVFLRSQRKDTSIGSLDDVLHTPKHMILIKERCDAVGAPAVLSLPGMKRLEPPDAPDNIVLFLFQQLGLNPE